MTETRLYEPARVSTPLKPLFSLKPLDATTWLRSWLSKVFPNCYLYKCSHFLCSQACTCSCKSQLCLYNSHLCDNNGFHPCTHQFLEEVENIKLQGKHNYLQKKWSEGLGSKLYHYKCSHFLCSQACTCSYMSQECWYSWHWRHTDEFYPCIHPGLL